MPEEIQRVVDSMIQLWNTGDPNIAKRVYTDLTERYDPNLPEPARGSDGIARYVSDVRKGYPDFAVEMKDSVIEGDRFATHWTVTGTHTRSDTRASCKRQHC